MQLKKGCRNILILAVFITYTSSARSQVIIALLFGDKLNSGKMEFGLTGGLSLSDISNFEDAKTKNGFNLGLYFNIKLNDKWYIHPEAVPKFPTGVSKLSPYSLGDANLDSLFQHGSVTRKIKNIAVPVLMRYRIANQSFIEAGPQIGLRTKAKDVFENGNLTYENKIEDDITRFDFGFAFGIAQKLRKEPGGITLSGRYYLGLTDIDKRTTGSQKNGVVQINASIAVGAKKKPKTKE
jgi:Outer membrane protein beta-barrel domain